MELSALLDAQRTYFRTGSTRSLAFRELMLDTLYREIRKMEPEINAALQADLGKSGFETYMCETGLTLSEISFMKSHLRDFAAKKRVRTPIAQFPSKSYVLKEPYGCVLIMSPWNYPFMLTMEPLADAIAAGNTVILKPSAYSPATSSVIKRLIASVFPEEYVAVVEGGRAENQSLLEQQFDYIFFTGGTSVGKLVLQKAAEHFTPVTLEMGGKSPCIVDRKCNLKLAARRIVFGKFLNCGQTCVAPDYIYCDRKIKDRLMKHLIKQIRRQYSETPLQNPDYGKIINEKHFDRLCDLISSGKVAYGGKSDPDTLRIEPTILDSVSFEDPVMQQEIFGPVLPIITYDSMDEVIPKINSMAHPLALYIFTSRRKTARKFMEECSFGGGCINDTLIHLATSEMGFGGFGESGMGAYHGEEGFRTFSHYKSIVDKKTWIDLSMRYQPYKPRNEKLLHRFLK